MPSTVEFKSDFLYAFPNGTQMAYQKRAFPYMSHFDFHLNKHCAFKAQKKSGSLLLLYFRETILIYIEVMS